VAVVMVPMVVAMMVRVVDVHHYLSLRGCCKNHDHCCEQTEEKNFHKYCDGVRGVPVANPKG
jgi:hypothetical protein